jgi:glycosyltransferase involved in cell wall biosynthesis
MGSPLDYYRQLFPIFWAIGQLIVRHDRAELARAAFKVLGRNGIRGIYQTVGRYRDAGVSYDHWLASHGQIPADQRALVNAAIEGLADPPLISVVMPVYDTPPHLLNQAIESVRRQLYPHWELCIADDASPSAQTRDIIARHAGADKRIKYVVRDRNGHISAASNSALALAKGEFVAFLDHDDELSEDALYIMAEWIRRHPETSLLYSDEDKMDAAGRRFQPHFKPDLNPDLILGQNYICHLLVIRKSLVDELGGFRSEFDGAQDWDLVLRALERISPASVQHVPHVLYHWRATRNSTAGDEAAKPYAYSAGAEAVREHLARTGRTAEVTGAGGGHFHIRFPLPTPAPRVSIIVPTRNRADLLRRCIDSVRRLTTYPDYEILVIDNDSDDPTTLELLSALNNSGAARVLKHHGSFNFSAINNAAVAQARGEVLCLLNNDIEVISPDWLEEMVSLACRQETGAVGAMLYYPDDTIQHAGTLLGLGGVAGHLYRIANRDTLGYANRAALMQNLSAVTAACLVVRRCVYDEVEGLNERDLAVAFNDVDFCLRLVEQGYRNTWTPFAELYHHESASRGPENVSAESAARFLRETEYMKRRWGHLLEHDPAHNPNLSLDSPWPIPARTPRINKPWLN